MKNKFKNVATIYIVINNDGEYYRRNGYGGGDAWTLNIELTRVYLKISSARTVVSFFEDNYKEYKPPNIYELINENWVLLDDSKYREKRKDLKNKELNKKKEIIKRIEKLNKNNTYYNIINWPLSRVKEALRHELAKNIKL